MNKNKKVIVAISSAVTLVLVASIVVYIFFPKFYTNPDAIGSYSECESTGYDLTDNESGSKTCTLPSGKTFQSNGL